jgi:FdhD protein
MDVDALTPDFSARAHFAKPSEALIRTLPNLLRNAQELFEVTGGIHGAGLVGLDGELFLIAEDIGRHNAMDKLIGRALRLGMSELKGGIVVVTSRISFDLVQKALMGGVSTLVGVGAASDLAHGIAAKAGLHLFSFTKVSTTNYHPPNA